jgi:hypothetical protein
MDNRLPDRCILETAAFIHQIPSQERQVQSASGSRIARNGGELDLDCGEMRKFSDATPVVSVKDSVTCCVVRMQKNTTCFRFSTISHSLLNNAQEHSGSEKVIVEALLCRQHYSGTNPSPGKLMRHIHFLDTTVCRTLIGFVTSAPSTWMSEDDANLRTFVSACAFDKFPSVRLSRKSSGYGSNLKFTSRM